MSWMMETIKMNRAELLAVLWSVAVECQKLKWQKNRENALAADIVKGVILFGDIFVKSIVHYIRIIVLYFGTSSFTQRFFSRNRTFRGISSNKNKHNVRCMHAVVKKCMDTAQ